MHVTLHRISTTGTRISFKFSNTYLFMCDVVDINSAKARPNVPSMALLVSC